MRLGPIGSTSRSSITFSLLAALSLTTVTSTARNSVAPRSALLLSIYAIGSGLVLPSQQPVFASASIAPVSQKNFRIGHPAAALQYSTMSSASLPAQNERFAGFESTPTLQPSAATSQLIRDAMDLFSAKPSAAIFARSWSPNAIFADPICHAEGAKQYLAQWYGMPAAFAHSETLEWKLVKDDQRRVEYVQKQRYKVKGLGTVKDMVSTVVMERGVDGKVTRFEDRWNHNELGKGLGWPLRRLNALTLPWLVGVPKETKAALEQKDL